MTLCSVRKIDFFRHSKIECEFRAFCTDALVVGSDGELAAEVAEGIIIEGDSQLQFNGHPSLAVAEIPDTFLRPFGSKILC